MFHQIRDLVLVPSLYCNYTCPHCCRSAGPHRSERMNPRVWGAVRDLFYRETISSLTVSGGEPFAMDQTVWETLFDVVSTRGGLDSLCVITNGAWAADYHRRFWFFDWWVPRAKGLLSDYPSGIAIDLSNDQYHPDAYQMQQRWRRLQAEAQEGYVDEMLARRRPDEEEDDSREQAGFFAILDDDVHLGLHGDWIHTVQPLGRGRKLFWALDKQASAFCDVESDEDGSGDPDCWYSHTLTVYPDGRVSGCCGGGGWVGNLLTMELEDIFDNHVRLWQENKRRFPSGIGDGLCQEACAHCPGTARRLFGTSFKEA